MTLTMQDGESSNCLNPEEYTGGDNGGHHGYEAVSSIMGRLAKYGFDFAGWDTEPDGTRNGLYARQEVA